MKSQEIRLELNLDQRHRIEAGLNECNSAKSKSNVEGGTKRRLGRNEDVEITTYIEHTWPRQNDQSLHGNGRVVSISEAKGNPSAVTATKTIDHGQASKWSKLDSRDSYSAPQICGAVDAALHSTNSCKTG